VKSLRWSLFFFAFLGLGLLAPQAAAQVTAESAGAPPEDLPEAVLEMVASEGVRVQDADGKVLGEFWPRTAAYDGEPVSGFGIRFSTIPEGAFLGVVRFPEEASDFREQTLPAGVYTIRYGLHPEDGNHMGVAPSRDFGILIPLAEDPGPKENLAYAQLVALSRKAGTPHPAILRIGFPEGDEAPNVWENDYGHWMVDLEIAGETVGIVVVGHAEV